MTKKMKKNVNCTPNVPNWCPTDSNYALLFCECDGLWLECSHNVKKFADMSLADYLDFMHIVVPDYCQFMRIIDYDRDLHFEWRSYGGRVRIDVNKITY